MFVIASMMMMVVFVAVSVAVRVRKTKSLPCNRRRILVARVSTRTHATAGKLLDSEGREHHE